MSEPQKQPKPLNKPSKKPAPAAELAIDPLEEPKASKAGDSVVTKTAKEPKEQGKEDGAAEQNAIGTAATDTPPGKKLSRKQIICIVAISLGVLVLASISTYVLTHKRAKPPVKREATKTITAPPKPKTLPSPLTGVEVTPVQAEHPVVAVVIENLYPSARPQSGLSSAGVVYETLAEGGITRYLALFGDTIPADIGPVRSLRTFFVRWGLEYGVPVVHAGGNIDALDMISPLGLKDLDQFYNGNYFRRITARYAPHNLYTSGDQLEKLMQAKGYYTKPVFTPWLRKDDAKSTAPTAASITIDPSYYDYQVSYAYDPADNSYTRSIRGVADTDANGNVPIKPKNVVVLKAATTYGITRVGSQATYTQTVGTGTGIIFTDGVATEITWSKPNDSARTKFLDTSGKEVALNRGQTWVTVIPLEKTVSYK